MSPAEDTQQPDDMMTISDAARLVGIAYSTIKSWVQAGKLPSERRGPHGVHYVSLAEARALGTTDALAEARANGFVSPSEAIRLTGLSRGQLASWSKAGTVATIPGPYGRLVRLTDVEAQAAMPQPAPQPPMEHPPIDPTGEYVSPIAAARHVGANPGTIRGWGKRRDVRTQAGPYGLLVHLGDVHARAAAQGRGGTVEGKE